MLFSTLFAMSGLAVTLGSAAAVIRPRQADGFQITYAYSSNPSPRPGSSQYCDVAFNVTDPTTQTSTQCKAQHGPCVGNSEDAPKPEIPLDRDHPAACADASFAFYLDVFEGISNYSLAITRQSSFGVTDFINRDNYADYYHYNCGGSGFCTSAVSGTVINAPFISEEE